MAKLRLPLVEHLENPSSEDELHRVWHGVRQRRTRRASAGFVPLWAWAAAAVVGAMVAIFAFQSGFAEAGPLLVDGAAVESLGGDAPTVASLSDGSRIDLGSSSALEVLHNDGRSFVSVLRKGRGTFDVQPGGPRRWRVEAAGVAVEVVGTRFDVVRAAEQVTIRVNHGVVLVRGEAVPDKVQRLLAGDELVVPVSAPARTVSKGDGNRESAHGPASAPLLEPEGVATPEGSSSAMTAHTEASAPSESRVEPAVQQRRPAEDLSLALHSADRQRARGNRLGAIQTLRDALNASSADVRRPLVAFTLAKVLLEAGETDEAEHTLRACLDSNPGKALEEDAWARLVEAQARNGKKSAARGTAERYAKRYPQGRRLEEVQRWAQGD